MPNDRFDSATRWVRRALPLAACALALAGCVTTDGTVASAPPRPHATRTAALAPPMTAHVPAAVTRAIAPHASAPPKFRPPPATAKSFDGIASFYWEGTRVASGAPYHPEGLTAAHRSLPLGTRVRVSDRKTGRSVVVTINDRGPYVAGRVLDLSVGAARALGIEDRGVSHVHAEVF